LSSVCLSSNEELLTSIPRRVRRTDPSIKLRSVCFAQHTIECDADIAECEVFKYYIGTIDKHIS